MPPVLTLMALLAQAPAVPAQDAQLDRLREALAGTPAIAIPATIPAQPDDSGRSVFRVRVQLWTFKGHPWDKDATIVPDYVRPSMPLAHYEFLKLVTSEDFRATALYPGMLGYTFDPVVVKKFVADWRRTVAEKHAREEIRRDVEAYLRARAEVR